MSIFIVLCDYLEVRLLRGQISTKSRLVSPKGLLSENSKAEYYESLKTRGKIYFSSCFQWDSMDGERFWVNFFEKKLTQNLSPSENHHFIVKDNLTTEWSFF